MTTWPNRNQRRLTVWIRLKSGWLFHQLHILLPNLGKKYPAFLWNILTLIRNSKDSGIFSMRNLVKGNWILKIWKCKRWWVAKICHLTNDFLERKKEATLLQCEIYANICEYIHRSVVWREINNKSQIPELCIVIFFFNFYVCTVHF